MSFAKKMARKKMKVLKKDVHDLKRDVKSGIRQERHLTTKEIIKSHAIAAEAYDNLVLIFDVAVHRKWGWGPARRQILHKKMAMHILCMKSGMVTTPDIEKILRDELGIDLEKRHLKAESWDREREIKYRVIDDMSAIFMLSLSDQFGYKRTALERVYDVAADVAAELKYRKKTIADLKAELNGRKKKEKTA